MKMHPMRGVSVTMAVGKWTRPHIQMGDYSARLCLGFVAVTFYTLDIERFVTLLIRENK